MYQLVDGVTLTERTASFTIVQTKKDTDDARREQCQAGEIELAQVLLECHSLMWIKVEEKKYYGASDDSEGSRIPIGRNLTTENNSCAQIDPETPGRMNRNEYVLGIRIYRCLLTISTTHDRREHLRGEAPPRLRRKKV